MDQAETATYVGERSVLDADSHVMELADFLDDFVDPEYKDRLRDMGSDSLAAVLTDAVAKSEARHSDTEVAKLAEERLLSDKGWHAMGAFDPTERSRVLDLLGVDAQLVFATFATARFAGRDEDRLYAGSSAQNRAMANFCSEDKRLLPVAYVPLVDPDRAVGLALESIEAGCAAVMVPSTAAGTRAPTHPDLDGFWDVLSEADVPFVLHVGGGGRLLDPAFHNNAMPVTDHLGGGENVRSKDFLGIPHS
ncbi:MAG TPA: amidohydrolase family protein, partial [Acidimicrobiales bacterium]|nr:amidohydrolase family protein [Acidimicrobiales bacterium]